MCSSWTILCNISGDFIPGDQSHLHWLTKQPMTQCIIAPNHIHLEGHTFHGHLPASLRGHLCSPSSQMYQDRSLSVRRFPSRKITSSSLFGSPPFSIIMFLCYWKIWSVCQTKKITEQVINHGSLYLIVWGLGESKIKRKSIWPLFVLLYWKLY